MEYTQYSERLLVKLMEYEHVEVIAISQVNLQWDNQGSTTVDDVTIESSSDLCRLNC